MRELTQLKQVFPEYKEVHAQVLQNVIKKLQRSFENSGNVEQDFHGSRVGSDTTVSNLTTLASNSTVKFSACPR